jgi:peptidoglycan/LPS O-acetylase OafA/YrhL
MTGMATQPPGGDGRNNPWLDLVRALAILLVLFRHGERALQAKAAGSEGMLQTLFLNGWIGVDLFFVLSGYLIARHLLRAGIGSPEFGFGRYVAMRALRILPAYYAVLVLTAAGAFPLFPVSGEWLELRFAYHLMFLQDYLPSDINVVFWSLGVEEKFYLLAPLLILMLLRCRSARVRIALLVSLCVLPMMVRTAIFHLDVDGMDYPEFWRTYRSPFHMALEGLIAGVAIALAQHAGAIRQARRIGSCVLAGSILVLLIWSGSHDFMAELGAADVTLQPALIALLAGAITLGGVQLAGTPMPLARPIQALARLSYSLYLIHYPLIPLVLALTLSHGAAAFWSVYLVVSLIAALLVHLAVERPFLVWKDEIAKRARPGASTRALVLSER